ncbi:MAG: diaminopimelate epimerase [Dehalococcoidia bacterium]|nr:diaminopimelate epimerase [Dehalococcoidia bacterium]
MRFTKLHGAGNDYLFTDGRQQADWPAVARAISHRHLGVGADGVILALPSTTADIRMRMFNADGSEGEMCGNGIRCLVRFAMENNLAQRPKGRPFRVETLAGIKTVEPVLTNGVITGARVGMGKPILRPADIPVNTAMLTTSSPSLAGKGPGVRSADLRDTPARPEPVEGPLMDHLLTVDSHALRLTCVSMGNPHAVAFLTTPIADFPLHQVGPKVEHHPFFPRRVNFEIVNVVDRGHLNVRVWERGSGETMACGTGACAVAVAARLHGLTDDTVDITLHGGTLRITWDGVGEVVMEGPIAEVFDVEWDTKNV